MLDFSYLPFDRMGEADVREEVLAPLVRELGYRTGTEFDIIREQSLRYPKIFLGRKNPKKDAELRGKADYILEVRGQIRWVLEAKAPGVEIGIDEIEQAWTYANHAEVRAVYFVICNGHELKVFSTQNAPTVGAFLTVPYAEMAERFAKIADVLSPVAIKRDFPGQAMPIAHPIGPGLRAFTRIASGMISYNKSTLNIPMLSQMQIAIVDGAVERDENSHLVAYMRTQAPLRSFQDLNERLGLDVFEMLSQDSEVSIDPCRPTEFVYEDTIIFPEGTEMLDVTTWQNVRLPTAVRCKVTARAFGSLRHRTFSGRFISEFCMPDLGLPLVTSEGDFFLVLA